MDHLHLPTGLLVKQKKQQKLDTKKIYGNMLNNYFFNKFYEKRRNKTRKNYT